MRAFNNQDIKKFQAKNDYRRTKCFFLFTINFEQTLTTGQHRGNRLESFKQEFSTKYFVNMFFPKYNLSEMKNQMYNAFEQ